MILDYRRSPPCRVFDAYGNPIDYIYRADTKTGECIVVDFDHAGNIKLNESRNAIARKRIKCAAPLRVSFIY